MNLRLSAANIITSLILVLVSFSPRAHATLVASINSAGYITGIAGISLTQGNTTQLYDLSFADTNPQSYEYPWFGNGYTSPTDTQALLNSINSLTTLYPSDTILGIQPNNGSSTSSFIVLNEASTTDAQHYYLLQGSTAWSTLGIGGGSTLAGPYAVLAPENCAVPEPSTAVLFLVGLGLICLIGLHPKFKGQIHIA